jgi:hypothetical protein
LLARVERIALSTPLLGAVITIITWPWRYVGPEPGLDPSWVAALYMEFTDGLQAGTEIVFTFGPLGFLGFPKIFEVWPARFALIWMALSHFALYAGLLWASRRAFRLVPAFALTLFAALIPHADPIVIAVLVLGIAALFGDWAPRSRLLLAAAMGGLAGIQLLASMRAGPILVAVGFGVLLGLPDRRRTFPVFLGTLAGTFFLLWFTTGQGLGNLWDYAINTASVVSGYSASMGVGVPETRWQVPTMVIGTLTIATLTVAAAWRRDRLLQVGLALAVAAVTFSLYKHAVVRLSPHGFGLFLVSILGVGLALTPYVRRWLAIGATAVLVSIAFIGNEEAMRSSLDFGHRARDFRRDLEIFALPGRAEAARQLGRETMINDYDLSPAELRLLRSGSFHSAPTEAGVAWAYDLDWAPLPVFQQYSAYTPRLDKLNAAKLESPTAPEVILWNNSSLSDPNAVNAPGALDSRWPAFESPAQMLQMFCRYRMVRWDERWAIVRRGRDRCGRERPLGTVSVPNGERVGLPSVGKNEALILRVDGLGVSGVERLRSMLFRATPRTVVVGPQPLSMVGETAADGLLLQAPQWADYPGPFRLGRIEYEIAFARGPGFLTGVGSSTRLTYRFSALRLHGPATEGRLLAAQKRRAQR